MMRWLLVSVVCSCGPVGDSGLGLPTDSGNTAFEPPATIVTVETIDDHADPSTMVFDLSVVHDIELELSAAAWDSLAAEPYEFVEGAFSFDGLSQPSVGIRLKGKLGSFRPIGQKSKFRVDFNRYTGTRFFGLEALNLNNSVQDCSYVKEAVSYALFRSIGVPAPRVAYARLMLNGTDYGLYILVEPVDDVFLSRNWPDGSGNLYDGSYVLDIPGQWLIDVIPQNYYYMTLDEGVDIGMVDLENVAVALDSSRGTPTFYETMDEVVDWERFHGHMAAEHWVGHVDGYGMMPNNYRVYFDPADNKVEWIPWDTDQAFLYDWQWFTTRWHDPDGQMAAACWDDPTCEEQQRQSLARLIEQLPDADLAGLLDQVSALTEEAASEDPMRPCSFDSVLDTRNAVAQWLANRNDEMTSFWGL